jgi:hypothetical protein
MTTLAEIVRQYGDAYREKYGERLLPSHRRTLQDIAQCRTVTLGGHVYHCDHCDETRYRYHSCQNRHCPQCQHDQGQAWLDRQQAALLPVPYFMVTFTLPAALHQVARSHQKTVYNILFRTSAAALQKLARDPRYVGGQIGMVGVLHTWGRTLSYHPHVHYLVPAGGLSPGGDHWLSARSTFLVPVKALSRLIRAKFRDALKKADLFDRVPAAVWQQDWVVHCQPVGKGQAALKYLAPYIFRVAISNRRILKVTDGRVTFRYRATETGRWQRCTLGAEEFLRRFLQHVLPKGFVKVRYYGLFSPSLRHLLPIIRLWLDALGPDPIRPTDPHETDSLVNGGRSAPCWICGHQMRWVQRLRPRSRCPPREVGEAGRQLNT